jgi:hypothetical protein
MKRRHGSDDKHVKHVIVKEKVLMASTGMSLPRAVVNVGALAATVVALVAVLAFAVSAQAASPGWKVFGVTGPTNLPPVTQEVQKVAVDASGGTFTLTFGGDTTSPLAFNSSSEDLKLALQALPSLSGANAAVSGGPGNANAEVPYTVSFGGDLAGSDVAQMTADSTNLTGGTAHTATVTTTTPGSPIGQGQIAIYPTNVGGAATSGAMTVTVGPLPAGITTSGPAFDIFTPPDTATWNCPGGAGLSVVTCTSTRSFNTLAGVTPLQVPVAIDGSAAAQSSAPVSISGGGASAAASADMRIVVSSTQAPPGVQAFWAGAFNADGEPETQAGAHPYSAISAFYANTRRAPDGRIMPSGDPWDVLVDLPAGFVGNPLVTKRCPQNALIDQYAPGVEKVCKHSESMVGAFQAMLRQFGGMQFEQAPIDNDIPAQGYPAQFTGIFTGGVAQSVLASVRSDDDYGVTAFAPRLSSGIDRVYGGYAFLEGFPSAAGGKAFLANPTECSGDELPTLISVSSWHDRTFSAPVADDSPPVAGCELVPFEPVTSVVPSSSVPDSASGLDVSIDLPQDGLDEAGELATSHLKKTVVRLPEGFSVNPSGATGLAGCSDAQIGLKSKAEPTCPDAAKLGTVSVTSPLIDQSLEGVMYLGTPKSTDPMSGEMLRLFLVVRNDRFGLLVKLPGSATADPSTGRLTATFDENPRVPFDHLEVKLRGGSRGVLATGQDCGPAATSTTLSPWSGTADVTQDSPFNLVGGCDLGFSPKVVAGSSNAKARGNGAFSFKFSRGDGEQWVDGLTVELPRGLLASVKNVPLCSNGQAAAGVCPESSRIGSVDGTAGSGNPFVLEQKGSAYLTEGYKGCPYGLVVKVPVVAGPFDGTTPETDLGDIVVRQGVCVDRTTAEVSVISDPIPTIWHGIPLRIRSVTVAVDRPGFMLNPSDCSAKQVGATFHSQRDAASNASVPFQASGCAGLPFKPKLTLELAGRKQIGTGKHPGVKAQVTQQGASEAGIEQVVVRLPKSLALDPENAQALCEFTDGTKRDLENRCPKGSIVGRARAMTPLLNRPLTGNVYFVKNVRTDPKTGNQIRTLPMIIVALRGEIAVNLKGESSTLKNGRLVNTFANIPDAPISQFNLNINGGQNGILAVTRTRRAKINLCAGRQVAEADTDAQNGRRHDTDIRMKTPCTKKQTKAAKLRAKRAAAKAKRG